MGHKRTKEPRSCGSGNHKWKRFSEGKEGAYRTMMPPWLGSWWRCAKCGFATSDLLQEEGWDPNEVTYPDAGSVLVRSDSRKRDETYDMDRRT